MRRVIERAPTAVLLAGLVMALGGYVSGEKSVGEGCGSGFDPRPGDSQSASADECMALLDGRGAAAWELIVAGLGLAVGGLYAGSRRAPHVEKGGPAGAGKPWRDEAADGQQR